MNGPSRHRLTYANVMSTLAVFIALGGSSYAAATIHGSTIANRSISSPKIKRNTLTGLEIRERTLQRVPRASIADNARTLEGLDANRLIATCPPDTVVAVGGCVERTARPATDYSSAILVCSSISGTQGFGRRLPTHGELRNALTYDDVVISPQGELTSEIVPTTTRPRGLDVIYVTNEGGDTAVTPDVMGQGKPFRCATDPHRP